jgi:hypothetical protein
VIISNRKINGVEIEDQDAKTCFRSTGLRQKEAKTKSFGSKSAKSICDYARGMLK